MEITSNECKFVEMSHQRHIAFRNVKFPSSKGSMFIVTRMVLKWLRSSEEQCSHRSVKIVGAISAIGKPAIFCSFHRWPVTQLVLSHTKIYFRIYFRLNLDFPCSIIKDSHLASTQNYGVYSWLNCYCSDRIRRMNHFCIVFKFRSLWFIHPSYFCSNCIWYVYN